MKTSCLHYSCCYTDQHHQSVKRSSDSDQSVKRSSDSVPPPAKRPAVTSDIDVDLSDIPDGTLGEWLCKHIQCMTCYIEYNDFTHLHTDDDHLPLLMVALIYRAYQWEHLGTQLGLKYGKLQVIERNRRGKQMDCMQDMLVAWLHGSGGECSKQALITALQNIHCF